MNNDRHAPSCGATRQNGVFPAVEVTGVWKAFDNGRVSVLEGDVHQAALAAEKDAAALVNANRNLPPDEFAARLRENALRTEASWKELYGRLLVEHNQGKETRYTQDMPGDDVSHY